MGGGGLGWDSLSCDPGPSFEIWRVDVFLFCKNCDFSFDPLHVFGTCFSFEFEFLNGHKIWSPRKVSWVHLKETCFPLEETWIHLKESWFPLKETWFPLKETWFPLEETRICLKESRFPLKETWFPLRETCSHLNFSGDSLSDPERMVVASTVVFLQKVSIFGTSKNAMGQIHFFIFVHFSELRDFSRIKNRTGVAR